MRLRFHQKHANMQYINNIGELEGNERSGAPGAEKSLVICTWRTPTCPIGRAICPASVISCH